MPRERPATQNVVAVTSMPGGPDAPLSLIGRHRRRGGAGAARRAPSLGLAGRPTRSGWIDQPIRVLPGSMRALIDWRVIELVNVTSMRPCVPPLLLTTWL